MEERNASPKQVIQIVNEMAPKSVQFELPLESPEKTKFCAFFTHDGVDDEGVADYLVEFVMENDSAPCGFIGKTYLELEEQTGVNFSAIFAEGGMNVSPTNHVVLLFSGEESLLHAVQLCDDIVRSINAGGGEPENAGILFRSYYQPEITIGQHNKTSGAQNCDFH